MAEETAVRQLLQDSFERVRELVAGVTDGLGAEASGFRVDAEANTVAWLVWHLSRVQDDHVAGVAGTDQVWPAWRDRFALPFDDDETGYAMDAGDVAEVRVAPELLAGYHAEVHAATLRYVRTLTTGELERVVDERWDPPVTVSARLVSVLGDCLQHLGQAAFVRGVAERAGH